MTSQVNNNGTNTMSTATQNNGVAPKAENKNEDTILRKACPYLQASQLHHC